MQSSASRADGKLRARLLAVLALALAWVPLHTSVWAAGERGSTVRGDVRPGPGTDGLEPNGANGPDDAAGSAYVFDLRDIDGDGVADSCDMLPTTSLLRNDSLTTLDAASSLLAGIFTGRASGCLSDPSISLDAADPGDCSVRVEGEGPVPEAPGSLDADDLYLTLFLLLDPAPEPDAIVLGDLSRPLVFWQLEGSAKPNGLRLTKDAGGVLVSYAFH